eukprot:scaffold17197_cov32-Tisochrysis_lutea.AAC.1
MLVLPLIPEADLAQTRQLDDEAFVRYLDYLQYWRKPEYAQHIAFPHCLHFLKLLQDSTFRDAMKRPDFKDFIAGQQHAHWRYRLSILDEAREEMRAQNGERCSWSVAVIASLSPGRELVIALASQISRALC